MRQKCSRKLYKNNEDRSQAKGLPASKLSYLGELNESRENARASGEAARGTCSRVFARLTSLAQTGELARRLAKGEASTLKTGKLRYQPVNPRSYVNVYEGLLGSLIFRPSPYFAEEILVSSCY